MHCNVISSSVLIQKNNSKKKPKSYNKLYKADAAKIHNLIFLCKQKYSSLKIGHVLDKLSKLLLEPIINEKLISHSIKKCFKLLSNAANISRVIVYLYAAPILSLRPSLISIKLGGNSPN